jgi:glycerophosphoryl diester phosphodiesterase
MNANVWGHRGCRGAANPPENSLAAFQSAVESGVGGIELDVHLSKDRVLVVFHDATLERMTGVAAEVTSLTLPELKKLRLLTVEKRLSKERIPTLNEVLDLVDGRRQSGPFVVNIEIKDPRSAQAVAAIIRQRLAVGWSRENFLISSFEMSCLRDIKALLPTLPIGTLFECSAEDLAQKMEETADLKPVTINIPFSALTPAASELIQAAGAMAVVWTPNETSPIELPPTKREKLIKRLREREFVAITDFPKELFQILKPNKARATAAGVLAACLAYGQQDILFRPNESGLEGLKSPSEYPQLKRFGFSELQLTAEDGVHFMAWERRGALDRPHFVLFHGNRAHWGDTGVGDPQRDRRARLKFIEELASSGAGVTAVTLRGFGGSSAIPSELGFLRDLRAVTEHLVTSGFHHRRLVVAGESLGTWAATQTAVYLTQRNSPPALLSLQNPFTCMADVGEEVVSQYPMVRSLNIGISASALDRHVLKNHFYTANLLLEVNAGTVVHIATSGKDDLVHPSHSEKLAEIARGRNLRVVRDVFAEALHHNIPPVDYARRLICLGVESCDGTSDLGELWGEPLRAIPPMDQMPYL